MDVSVADVPERGRYEARTGDEVVGFAAYRLRPDVVELLHTEVDPAHEGEGVGSALARGTLDDVRRRGLAVLPVCRFMRGFIDHHRDEYVELVPEGRRASYGLG